MEAREPRLSVNIEQWYRQRQVGECKDCRPTHLRVGVHTVAHDTGKMTEVEVLEFGAERGDWSDADKRFPTSVVFIEVQRIVDSNVVNPNGGLACSTADVEAEQIHRPGLAADRAHSNSEDYLPYYA